MRRMRRWSFCGVIFCTFTALQDRQDYEKFIQWTLLLLMAGLISCRQTTSSTKGVVVISKRLWGEGRRCKRHEGVATGVDPDLKLYDLTHEIPAYNIWEAAYRLQQAAPYWPAGTVFVFCSRPGRGYQQKVGGSKNTQWTILRDP